MCEREFVFQSESVYDCVSACVRETVCARESVCV